ncbi:MAG: hypothetical protein JWP84_1207 [Tardiphaga sp.]|nr:hypothetical protein [Tardiphaga sp.]
MTYSRFARKANPKTLPSPPGSGTIMERDHGRVVRSFRLPFSDRPSKAHPSRPDGNIGTGAVVTAPAGSCHLRSNRPVKRPRARILPCISRSSAFLLKLTPALSALSSANSWNTYRCGPCDTGGMGPR